MWQSCIGSALQFELHGLKHIPSKWALGSVHCPCWANACNYQLSCGGSAAISPSCDWQRCHLQHIGEPKRHIDSGTQGFAGTLLAGCRRSRDPLEGGVTREGNTQQGFFSFLYNTL